MMLGSCFQGDENEALIQAQADLYNLNDVRGFVRGFEITPSRATGTVGYMYVMARRHLGFAFGDKLSFAVLLKRTSETDDFDHRVLQSAHDHMAAYYRWINRGRHEPIFSKDARAYHAFLIDTWQTYCIYEIKDLCQNPNFLESVTEAVVYANTNAGRKSEEELGQVLDKRYGRDCMELF